MVRATALARDEQIVRRLPAAFLGLSLVDVLPSDVLTVVADWPGGTGTRRRVRTTVQAFFTRCVRTGRLNASPARDVPVVATDAGRQPRPFSWAEVDALSAAVRPHRPDVSDAALIAAHTGVRAGELRALRVGDFRQVPYPRLIVSRSYPENARSETATKSGRSREVPLDGVVLPVVVRLARGRDLDAHLLTAPGGGLFSVRNARRDVHWDDIAPGHDWHDLRHTAAVEWAQMTDVLGPADIQTLLGHASLDTTERYLAGLSGTIRQTRIAAAFSQIVPAGTPETRHTGMLGGTAGGVS
jgi:integrase